MPDDDLLCSLSLLLHADPSLLVIDPALVVEYACLDGCVPGIGDTPRDGKGDWEFERDQEFEGQASWSTESFSSP